MYQSGDSIPVSTSLSGFHRKTKAMRSSPVNKRVFYLSIQVIVNAIVIGLIARCLVYLIDFITNISFYGKFSFGPASPAGNHLGIIVLFVPIVGAVLVGLGLLFALRA